MDLGIVYGEGDGEQLFTAKKLTVSPGVKTTITDAGAYGLICVQGAGKINRKPLNSPNIIRFDELTEDEYLSPRKAQKQASLMKTPARPSLWSFCATSVPK